VFGVPDDILGEAINAVVVLRPGTVCDEKQIQGFCQKHLAAFKIPRAVRFVSSLPKSQSGKINKLQLKEQVLRETTRGTSPA
jgi:long-chain acyl-CoA synthetase